MVDKKSNTVLIIIGSIIVLGILIMAYFLYMNIPRNPEDIDVDIEELPEITNQAGAEVKQFYPNMKFNHNSISYKIDVACTQEKENRVIEAFNELSDKVGLISFYSVSANPDIEVSCSEYKKEALDKDYFIAGEGGAKEIIQTGRYNVITQGIILLHENPHGFYKCEWANIELHELLHVFGFDHSTDKNSIMYAYLESCDQRLDDFIVNKLKQLYSEENLVDLYFEDLYVTKKGRYLDFNLTVKNSGSIDSPSTTIGVLDEGKIVHAFDLELLKYGAGIKIEIKNLKLIHMNPEKIEFVIDKDDLIKEIDEDNNIVEADLA